LIALGREAFAEYTDFPEVIALWWPRFEKIASWFVTTEAEWADVLERRVESRGEIRLSPHFLLTARADRLDALADGRLAIIDYKTGTPPSFKEMRSLSPQLPLEGLIARAGGFEDVAPTEPGRLTYYRLSGRGAGGECKYMTRSSRAAGPAELAETLAQTERRITDLVAAFARPDAIYRSNKIPKPRRTHVGEYDHLARISEWVATDQEEEE
jgi:ATP-dependent helicase/nuclease subunit B